MISVITPNYNGEKWLGDYFDSIAGQTLPQDEIEVIFMDDGSTDESRRIVEQYSDEIPGLKPVWHEHTARPGDLRNQAVRRAIGEYALFLDSDDYLGSESLERLNDFAEENPSDVFAFQLEGIDRNVPRSMLSKTVVDADIVDSGIYKTLGMWKMVKRDFIIDNGIRLDPSIRRGDDVLFCIEAKLKARDISILSGYPFYMLRGREDNSSITQDEWNHGERIAIVDKSLQLINSLSEDKNTADHFMIRLFNADALEIAESKIVTNETMDMLRKTLSPYWSKSVANLIYTDENRRKLVEIFGEPIDG